MKIARIPLHTGSRFHFGEFRIDTNVGLSSTSVIAHSDTLFSAIMNCAAVLGNADNLVKAFIDSEVNFSSLFYYLKRNDSFVYFLPKPVSLEIDSKIDGNHKKRNKIKFVSLGVWKSGFNQNQWFDPNCDDYKIIQDEFVLLKDEYTSILLAETRKISIYGITQCPKSPIRKTDEESIYYQTDIVISDNGSDIETGFYFFYELSNNDSELILKNAVNVLSKTGIGGERNNMGQKMGDPVFSEINLDDMGSDNYVSISLLSPASLDEYNTVDCYKTILRGGRRLTSGSTYQVVRMMLEGALCKSKINGKLIEIGKDDENNIAYRNGKAFLIPVRL